MQYCFCVSIFVFSKTHKKATRRPRRSYRQYTQLTMDTSNYIVSYKAPLPTDQKYKAMGNKIVEGTVIKAKIGELEEKGRSGNSRKTRKELTDVVQGISGRRRLLVRFKNGCKNNLSSNQLTVVIVEKIPVEEEPEVSMI